MNAPLPVINVFILVATLFLPLRNVAQTGKSASQSQDPQTILWKITGKGIQKPSYLLGTMHLGELDWLLTFPRIKSAIDSTEYILTEAFSTEVTTVTVQKTASTLRAVSVLNAAEYKTLDSFFVARVGEGITNNPDAEEMNVFEMWAAIYETLVMDMKGPDGITKSMDLDLFNLYKSTGRGGDHLDKLKDMNFDSTQIDDARKVMRSMLAKIPGSEKPGWNIYSQNTNIEETMRVYKQMKVPYQFEKTDSSDVIIENEYGHITIEQRNRNWLPKIEKNISQKPCLIAVGFGHLRYKTGLIVLLKDLGYQVEAVSVK
jgi:uncharacterized protein YbaP (TraB family)